MAKSVYIESTIPSLLAAWPSRDLREAARQQIAHDWWNNHRHDFELCTSQIVLNECAAGDPDAARRRLEVISDLPILDLTQEVIETADVIMDSGLLPHRAARDAVHIAAATVHEVDLLLTWNCRHIANAAIMTELEAVVASAGFPLPTICTPEELLGE